MLNFYGRAIPAQQGLLQRSGGGLCTWNGYDLGQQPSVDLPDQWSVTQATDFSANTGISFEAYVSAKTAEAVSVVKEKHAMEKVEEMKKRIEEMEQSKSTETRKRKREDEYYHKDDETRDDKQLIRRLREIGDTPKNSKERHAMMEEIEDRSLRVVNDTIDDAMREQSLNDNDVKEVCT